MEIQLNTPYVRVYVSTRLGINVISLSVSKSTALSVDKHKYRWLFSHIYMRAITLVYDPDLHSFFWLCLGFRMDTAGVII